MSIVSKSISTAAPPVYEDSSVNISRLAEIHKRLYAANAGGTLNYILSGDSTRATPDLDFTSVCPQYYAHLLDKIGVTVDNNSSSGMDSIEWRTDDVAFTQTLADCLVFASGTGADSIVEFSFGINDWTAASSDYATTKAGLVAALDALIAAKADIAILLVTPVKTGNTLRNVGIIQMYSELANEYSLPLISGYDATKDVHGDIDYYSQDWPPVLNSTHPNEFGLRRVANYVVNRIVPPTILGNITFDDMQNNPASVVVEPDFWSTSDGSSSTNAAWRRLQAISVPYGATHMAIDHSGNRFDCMVFKSGVFQHKLNDADRDSFLLFDDDEIRINISSDGTTWDALNETPTVVFSYMSPERTNKNLSFNAALEL